MTNDFCPACEKILNVRTDTQSVLKYCTGCEREYDGTDEDTLISSDFADTSGYNTNLILKYAPYDRVNNIVEKTCPTKGCKRRYMYKVFLNEQVTYVCDNCDIRLSGRDIL